MGGPGSSGKPAALKVKGPHLRALLDSGERIGQKELVALILTSTLDPDPKQNAVRRRELIREVLGLSSDSLTNRIAEAEAAAGRKFDRPLSRQAVSKVFRGKGISERVETGVADVFGVPAAVLFTDLYTPAEPGKEHE